MDPLRAILAATDFSDDARKAARRAAVLTAEHNAELTLMHVIEPGVLAALRNLLSPWRDLSEAMTEQARMLLDAAADTLHKETQVSAGRLLTIGPVLSEIGAAMSERDLLVLGARGSHAVREFVLGTTGDRLLCTGKKPLLAVRSLATQSYRRALVLVDFSASSLAAVHETMRLAPRASLTLFHSFEVLYEGKLRIAGVSDNDIMGYRQQARQNALQQLHGFRASLQTARQCSTVVEHGDVRLTFRQMVEQIGPDLVAVGKHGNSSLADTFLGSTTRTVLSESPCDVLIVPRLAQPRAEQGAKVG